MSMVTCKGCDSLIDSDFEPEGFYNEDGEPLDEYVCTRCQEAYAQAEWYRELNAGYAQDRI